MPHADVIVVGGGIVGCACAAALAADGMRVTVLESEFIGAGATSAGMGHIVVMDDSEAQFALTAYSRRLLDELLSELPAAVEHVRTGTLWVAEDAEQLAAAEAKCAYYRERGVPAELLDGVGLAAAEPRLRPGLGGALRVPDDSVVYPPALVAQLADRARRSGAVVREGIRVERIRDHGVDTSDGPIEAHLVVNAAGAAAPSLTPGLPIVPRRGHLLITDRYPAFCRHQIVELGYLHSAHGTDASSVAFNVQPRITGQLLIGSSRELIGWDQCPSGALLSRMLARATAFMPALAGLSAIRSWIGFRPATADKLPLIGPWLEQDGLWIAAGHEGLGITTALGTARLLADLIAQRAPAIDPAPFAPARAMSAAA
jgi:D-hydroxyproline dehydrogenase subunit beta